MAGRVGLRRAFCRLAVGSKCRVVWRRAPTRPCKRGLGRMQGQDRRRVNGGGLWAGRLVANGCRPPHQCVCPPKPCRPYRLVLAHCFVTICGSELASQRTWCACEACGLNMLARMLNEVCWVAQALQERAVQPRGVSAARWRRASSVALTYPPGDDVSLILARLQISMSARVSNWHNCAVSCYKTKHDGRIRDSNGTLELV